MATLSPNPNPNPNLFSLKQSHTLLKIPTPPVPSFLSSLISSYSALGERPPNPRTFPPLFKACAAASDLARGVQLHSHVVKFGFWHNMYVGVAVMDMYMKSGEVGEATKVFDGMGERDTVAWNALVTGYLQNGRAEEAVAVFERMRRAGVGVSGVAVASVVAACAQLRLSDLGNHILKFYGRKYGTSHFWKGVQRCRDPFSQVIITQIGDGSNTLFWQDRWFHSSILAGHFRELAEIASDPNCMIDSQFRGSQGG